MPADPAPPAWRIWRPRACERSSCCAPPGTVERRYVLALAPAGAGARRAPDRARPEGQGRLAASQASWPSFGCAVRGAAAAPPDLHAVRPERPRGLEDADRRGRSAPIEDLAPLDPARHLHLGPARSRHGALLANLPPPGRQGRRSRLRLGLLARAVLAIPEVTALTLIDIDRRAVEAARRNVDDPARPLPLGRRRARPPAWSGLDFVVMNPPFHDGGAEDQALGQAFIRRGAAEPAPGRRRCGWWPTGTCPTRRVLNAAVQPA